ncbi:MAG: type II toxin-antitoxin system VapC family toxin [Dehalococcoidia bacterium]
MDSGPLFAAFNRRDPAHSDSANLLRRTDLEFFVPVLCIAEVAYLIARDFGARAEALFISGCSGLSIVTPDEPTWKRMAEIMMQYSDFPLGAADAEVVATAERFDAKTIATLDHRHFAAIRPKHIEAFTLLP